MKRTIFIGTLAGLSLLGASGAMVAEQTAFGIAAQMHTELTMQNRQFRRIEQPIANKVAVTLGGLGLIGVELWWFLLSKPKSQKVAAREGIQEITITVDGGYEPSQIVVQAGRTVRLNFLRHDPSSCLESVRLPDFQIAQNLRLNQVTTVEFTPTQPGSYEFTCGMNMFRGIIEVQTFNPGSQEDFSQVLA